MYKLCTTGVAKTRYEYGKAGRIGQTEVKYKTKEEFIRAVSAGDVRVVRLTRNGVVDLNGRVFIEPNTFPKPPRWYAIADVQDNVVLNIIETGICNR